MRRSTLSAPPVAKRTKVFDPIFPQAVVRISGAVPIDGLDIQIGLSPDAFTSRQLPALGVQYEHY